MISFKLKGGRKTTAKLRKMGTLYQEAILSALYLRGVALARRVYPRIPQDTGALAKSLYINVLKKLNPELEIGVGEEYGVYVHEDTSMRHPRGGTAKFIEIPWRAMRQGFTRALAQDVKRMVRQKRVDAMRSEFPKAPK